MASGPSLIIQDFGGANNADLHKTRARLIKGGSWKRQGIVVVIPAGNQIPAKVVLSWMNLAFPPNNGVARILTQNLEVGEAYSTAIEQILMHPELSNWPYLLTLEHDNAPGPDAVIKLLEHMEAHPEFSCIGGLYFTKGRAGDGGMGGVAQCWGDPKDPVLNFRPQPPDPNGGLLEVCGTGMGFNIFRLAMFKDARLRRPWFKTQKEGGVSTQDLYFWADARKYGYRAAIACDVKVGHYSVEEDFMY